MKPPATVLIIIVLLLPRSVFSQLYNGGLYAQFGVDADTRSNHMKYGSITGPVASDDWFSPSGSGNAVLDTSNASFYLNQLKSGVNVTFSQRMAQLLYAKIDGKLWLDAVYGRDYIAVSTLKDSTSFTSAAKNGDNPITWTGGVASTPGKNDLVDVFAHMRRDGTTVHDSLWFFTGISTYATSGNSYFDVELYKNSFTYNSSTGVFSSAGINAGHTEWLFDGSGNIIQTGDLVVAVTSTPGSVPVIDIRIWVSQVTFNNYYGGGKSPARFNFNGNYNSSSGSAYGYASIVSKAGTTAFGGGISNYSAVSARDTTYATPWGTTVGGIGWSSEYATQQLVEVGINMTRIGVDPSLYSSLNPCQSLFSNIFFKSRSSSSFTANLQDFVTPLTFLRSPVMDFSLVSDTLRCNHRAGTIMLTNHTTAGYYTWKAVDGGNISGSNSDGSLLDIDKPGSYILSASPAEGCPTSLTAAIVVPVDTFPPVATALVGISGGLLQLYGGNAEASKYPTPFGGSQGLSWNWTGPGGFGATVQYPVTDMVWGTYQLSVTENRNGCTAIASTDVSAALFNALLANGLKLSAAYADRRVHLVWEDLNQHADRFFTIERGNDRNEYVSVGVVWNKNDTGAIGPASFNFVDGSPGPGNNLYRVKATTNQGETYYSRTVSVQTSSGGLQNAYLAGESLIVNADSESNVTMVVYTLIGQALQKKELSLLRGVNTIPVSGSTVGAPRILVLLLGGKVVWSRKILL